jgi:hypothetical protein
LEFYRRSAALSRQVAEVDRAHQQHARYWADREQAKAEELAAQPGKPGRHGGAADADAIPATLERAHDALKAARPEGGPRRNGGWRTTGRRRRCTRKWPKWTGDTITKR